MLSSWHQFYQLIFNSPISVTDFCNYPNFAITPPNLAKNFWLSEFRGYTALKSKYKFSSFVNSTCKCYFGAFTVCAQFQK